MTASSAEPDRSAGRSFHLPITIEQRGASRFARQLGVNLVALALALLAGAILLLIVGDDPFEVYREVASSAFGSARALRETFRVATPLILTGLSVTVAFRMGLWSIGAEGQLIAGAVVGAATALLFGPSLGRRSSFARARA